jgi:hypothetical protein
MRDYLIYAIDLISDAVDLRPKKPKEVIALIDKAIAALEHEKTYLV